MFASRHCILSTPVTLAPRATPSPAVLCVGVWDHVWGRRTSALLKFSAGPTAPLDRLLGDPSTPARTPHVASNQQLTTPPPAAPVQPAVLSPRDARSTIMELRVGHKYRLGRKIGSGSFGDIYIGTNITNG